MRGAGHFLPGVFGVFPDIILLSPKSGAQGAEGQASQTRNERIDSSPSSSPAPPGTERPPIIRETIHAMKESPADSIHKNP